MGGEIVSRECRLVGEGVCGIQMPEGKYLESVADGRAFARRTRISTDVNGFPRIRSAGGRRDTPPFTNGDVLWSVADGRAFALKTQISHRFPADITQIPCGAGRQDTPAFIERVLLSLFSRGCE